MPEPRSVRGERRPGVSVVVPVYNAEPTLETLVSRIETALTALPGFEILLIDDSSRDGSWDLICRLAAVNPNVRGISLMRNYGQHNALLCGIRAARHAVIVTIDDDLQNPPEEIPRLLDKLAEGYDVVYGVPEVRQHGLWRNLASGITRMFLRSVTPAMVARIVTGFRALRAEVANAFTGYESPFVFIDAILPWTTTRFASVSVRHEPRRAGASNYRFLTLFALGIDMMTGFSSLPLRMASMIGFAFTLFGAGVLAWVVGRYAILGYSLPGFPFLASIIAIFSGAQLFALGIIGEYLARMHFRTMGRPGTVVRRSVGFAPDPKD